MEEAIEPTTQPVVPPSGAEAPALQNMATNGLPQVAISDPSMTSSNPVQSSTTILPAQSSMPPNMSAQTISADEIALYDRQIRLWGVKAQEMIRNASILIIGMGALGNEIAKNLVLAGVGALTILDHQTVTEDDLCSQFLVSEQDLGKNRAEAAVTELKKMNPRVSLLADPDMISNKIPEYFAGFHLAIATGQMFEMFSTINMSCRMCNVKMYAADTYGVYGWVFADLLTQSFVIEKDGVGSKVEAETETRMVVSVDQKREGNKVTEIVTKQELYSPFLLANSSPLPKDAAKNRRTRMRVTPLLSCLRALFDFQKQAGRPPAHNHQDLGVFTKLAHDRHLELQLPIETLRAEFLRSFIQNLGSEVNPTVAFLGGFIAQDVINVLGQREQPLQNFLLFDGDECRGPVYSLHPRFDAIPEVLPQGGLNGEAVPVMNGTGAAPPPKSPTHEVTA